MIAGTMATTATRTSWLRNSLGLRPLYADSLSYIASREVRMCSLGSVSVSVLSLGLFGKNVLCDWSSQMESRNNIV